MHLKIATVREIDISVLNLKNISYFSIFNKFCIVAGVLVVVGEVCILLTLIQLF